MVKDVAAMMTGLGQALSGLFVSDEIVKGALASYSFENMEIASYAILIATAKGNTQLLFNGMGRLSEN